MLSATWTFAAGSGTAANNLANGKSTSRLFPRTFGSQTVLRDPGWVSCGVDSDAGAFTWTIYTPWKHSVLLFKMNQKLSMKLNQSNPSVQIMTVHSVQSWTALK